MKVTYEFNEPEDHSERMLFEVAGDMYNALYELANLKRSIYKGYEDWTVEKIEKKLGEILEDSRYYEADQI